MSSQSVRNLLEAESNFSELCAANNQANNQQKRISMNGATNSRRSSKDQPGTNQRPVSLIKTMIDSAENNVFDQIASYGINSQSNSEKLKTQPSPNN
jgi:hypothetical protein